MDTNAYTKQQWDKPGFPIFFLWPKLIFLPKAEFLNHGPSAGLPLNTLSLLAAF